MTEYTCDSFRFFNLFPVYFGGKGTAHFEPGLDVDLEFGISLFDKVVLDILNRKNPAYVPRLYHKMTQFMIFSGTDDRTYADDFWKKAFPIPIALRSLQLSDNCRRCGYCK